jgi:cytochrome d ubiquinol oxidase subunit II
MGFPGMAMTVRGLRAGREVSTLLWSKLGILGVISSVGLTMFPFILPSSSTRSIADRLGRSSSHHDAVHHAGLTVIFMPMILAYTAWVYKVLWGKVTEADVTNNSETVY